MEVRRHDECAVWGEVIVVSCACTSCLWLSIMYRSCRPYVCWCNRLKSVVISSRCKLGEGAFEPCTTISNQWDRAPTEADKMPSVLKSAAFIDAPPPSEAKLDPVARRWT